MVREPYRYGYLREGTCRRPPNFVVLTHPADFHGFESASHSYSSHLIEFLVYLLRVWPVREWMPWHLEVRNNSGQMSFRGTQRSCKRIRTVHSVDTEPDFSLSPRAGASEELVVVWSLLEFYSPHDRYINAVSLSQGMDRTFSFLSFSSRNRPDFRPASATCVDYLLQKTHLVVDAGFLAWIWLLPFSLFFYLISL